MEKAARCSKGWFRLFQSRKSGSTWARSATAGECPTATPGVRLAKGRVAAHSIDDAEDRRVRAFRAPASNSNQGEARLFQKIRARARSATGLPYIPLPSLISDIIIRPSPRSSSGPHGALRQAATRDGCFFRLTRQEANSVSMSRIPPPAAAARSPRRENRQSSIAGQSQVAAVLRDGERQTVPARLFDAELASRPSSACKT